MSGNNNSGPPLVTLPTLAATVKARKIVHRTLAEAAGVDITVVRKAVRGERIRVSSAQFINQALQVCTFSGKQWRAAQ